MRVPSGHKARNQPYLDLALAPGVERRGLHRWAGVGGGHVSSRIATHATFVRAKPHVVPAIVAYAGLLVHSRLHIFGAWIHVSLMPRLFGEGDLYVLVTRALHAATQRYAAYELHITTRLRASPETAFAH